MSIRPDVGDIGIIEHVAFNYHYSIVKVVKVTAARCVVCVLQPDGTWGEERSRKVGRFMFMPEDVSMAALLEIREELKLVAAQQMKAIADAKLHAEATVAMMAAGGKVLGK